MRATIFNREKNCEINVQKHRGQQECTNDPKERTQIAQMLRDRGWPEDMLQDIASHADYLHVPRDTNARKALYAVDEMCGFIIACALVKPDKSLGSVEPSGVRKKMKDKAFARGVHREELVAGAEQLGIPFDEHVEFVRDALKPIAPELGLNP